MTIEEADKILDEYAKNPEEEDDGYYSPSLVAIERARKLIHDCPKQEPNWICWEGEGGIVVYYLNKKLRLEWDKEGKLDFITDDADIFKEAIDLAKAAGFEVQG